MRNIASCINLLIQRVSLITVIVRNICNDQESFVRNQPERNRVSILSKIFRTYWTQKVASHLEIFSTGSIHVLENEAVWYSIRIVPSNACQTTLRCDLYAVGEASDAVRYKDVSDRIKASIQASLERFEADFKVQKAGKRYGKPVA
jgi:hypothetical protein